MSDKENAPIALARKCSVAYSSLLASSPEFCLKNPPELGTQLGQAEEMVVYLLGIIRRFVDVLSFDKIPDNMRREVKEKAEALVYYGFFTHCSLSTHPGRNKYEDIDAEALFHEWHLKSLTAGSILSHYHRERDNIPLRVFSKLYKKELEPLQKELRLGIWRRSRNRAKFKNLFESGVLLGMMCDIEASKM